MSITVSRMLPILLVGLGGVLGSSSRYGLALLFDVGDLPVATILVNWLGCFLLTYLTFNPRLKSKIPTHLLLLINTGFIGSFTTFSTFTVESITLLTSKPLLGLIYFFLQLTGGFLCCLFGYSLAIRGDRAL
ncbi:fluoride efflux transporter FluC [Aquibacillus kalidii]|uniref:fluoride efflux transporter FluC n=1 Tax=Aquibacillus kalidii TaxID=2762597 RepID=UPI001645F199|nr:CrcB family protein [Aquibacillus kalidii]